DHVWKRLDGEFNTTLVGGHMEQLMFEQSLERSVIEFKMAKWIEMFKKPSTSNGYQKTKFISFNGW
ncbi:hypothetical protein MKW94_029310, partial [Papaver nudicaule]|nr:hypothetical protein [Papaver nudicaule]